MADLLQLVEDCNGAVTYAEAVMALGSVQAVQEQAETLQSCGLVVGVYTSDDSGLTCVFFATPDRLQTLLAEFVNKAPRIQ